MILRPVWAEIDLKAIGHNLREVKKLVGSTKIMAVVKADAYGHGILEVSRACLDYGADRLAVAFMDEALILRRGGVKCPIMILGWTPPQDYERAIENDVILTIYNLDEARRLNQLAESMGKKATVHLKVDTGMTRIGLVPSEKSLETAINIMALENINVEGIYTHFSKADEADKSYSYRQLEGFLDFTAKIEKRAQQVIPIKHAANSAAIIDMPEAYLDMVRPGIILYGLKPSEEVDYNRIDLLPVLSIKAKVTRVENFPSGTRVSYGGTFITTRETKIASLPLGYSDGYSRLLSGKAQVLWGEKRLPVIGRICMNQCMVDVSEAPQVKVGDEFIIIGKGKNDSISVDEIAEKLGTINYEVICMLSHRLPKIYTNLG